MSGDRYSLDASMALSRLQEIAQAHVQEMQDLQPSRRERIATAALQGLLLNPTLRYVDTAKQAVRLADALIAELDKPAEVTP